MLEAKLPGSLERSENKRLASSLEKDMRAYFKAVDDAMPFEALEQIYYRHVKVE